jgi:hypothetical protein
VLPRRSPRSRRDTLLAPEHADEVRRVGIADSLGDGLDSLVRMQKQAARLRRSLCLRLVSASASDAALQ